MALLLGAALAAEPSWTVEHATSELGFTVDVGVTTAIGRFDSWATEIAVDRGRPEDRRARIEIDMGTVSIDDACARAVADAA